MSIENKKSNSCEEVTTVVNCVQEVSQVEARQTAERCLVRKLDSRLLPTIIAICLMNYIDRAAITAARLKGLQKDLDLSDFQYDTVVAILYASYCPAQIPSNMILNYISRPTFYIGTCVVLWGLTSALTGVTHNFAGIMACRVFVGIPEAAFFPGSIYLLSRWYTRKELTFRSAILAATLLFSYAFGNLWAAAILGNMEDVMGIAAWRWLFYIEGSITMLVGLLSMGLLPDYPHNTWWLTPAEQHLAQVRLAEDAGEADMDSQQASFFEGLKLAIKDPKIPIFMVMYCSYLVGVSFSNFFPTLVATLGYSTMDTLLLAAPPWALAAVITLINARHADATGERFFHMAIWIWVAMIGYIISLSTTETAARYISMFFMTAGECAFTVTIVWVANTFPRPPAKRSAAIALANGFANLGTLMGSYIWPVRWGPHYRPSMIIALCVLSFSTFLGFVIRTILVRENKRMEREESALMHGAERERVEEAARLEGITFDEAVVHRKGFRYLY